MKSMKNMFFIYINQEFYFQKSLIQKNKKMITKKMIESPEFEGLLLSMQNDIVDLKSETTILKDSISQLQQSEETKVNTTK